MRTVGRLIVGLCALLAFAGTTVARAQDRAAAPCPSGMHRVATSYGSYCAAGANYELIDGKTGLPLGGSARISLMGDSPSDAASYARAVLSALGCRSGTPPKAPGGSPAGVGSGGAGSPPCKTERLYIDPAADGSQSGRALVGALEAVIAKDGRVHILADPAAAGALFVNAGRYEMEQRAAAAAQEAKREQAEQEQVAAEAVQEAKHEQAEQAAQARRFAAAGRVGASRHYIAYVVESDCEDKQVDVTYTVGTDQTEQNTEYAPWADLVTYAPGSFYSVLAQKHDGSDYCSVSAEIYSVRLTKGQVDLWSNSSGSPVVPIKRYGKQLREANSDSAYGIASVSYSSGF